MKYLLEYDEFLYEDKYDLFIAINNQIPRIKKIRDGLWGKPIQIGEKKPKWFSQDRGILSQAATITAGIFTTIGMLYFIMWYHNKKLDKIEPEVRKKLKKYYDILEQEFSPKELDDLLKKLKEVINAQQFLD